MKMSGLSWDLIKLMQMRFIQCLHYIYLEFQNLISIDRNWVSGTHISETQHNSESRHKNKYNVLSYYLREYGASNSNSNSSRTLIYNSSLKMLVKSSDPRTTQVSTWLHMLSSTIIKAGSGRKWSTFAIFGRKLPRHLFPDFIEFESVSDSFLEKNDFPPSDLSHRRDVSDPSLPYPYFYGKYSDELHSWIPPSLSFTAMTCHATSIRPTFSPYSIIEKNVPLEQLLPTNQCPVEQTVKRTFSWSLQS